VYGLGGFFVGWLWGGWWWFFWGVCVGGCCGGGLFFNLIGGWLGFPPGLPYYKAKKVEKFWHVRMPAGKREGEEIRGRRGRRHAGRGLTLVTGKVHSGIPGDNLRGGQEKKKRGIERGLSTINGKGEGNFWNPRGRGQIGP